MLDRILKWESITPLGSPVLPLEKTTVAKSSRPAIFPDRFRSIDLGVATRARFAAANFSRLEGVTSFSSSTRCLQETKIFARFKKTNEVTTVLISHCRMHDSIPSADNV